MVRNIGIVILAAGLGTRLKSDKAKVLHEICNRPMIQYVVDTAKAVAGSNVIVVVGHQADLVRQSAAQCGDFHYATQHKQLGTGHAVMCALPHIPEGVQDVVILCGDVPLIRAETIEHLIYDHLRHRRHVTLLAVKMADPSGYGRVIFNESGKLTGIVEQADADEAQKKIQIVNSGIYVVNQTFLTYALPQIRDDNKQKEIYLTDIIAIGRRLNKEMGAIISDDSEEILGVNSVSDLQRVENIIKNWKSELS